MSMSATQTLATKSIDAEPRVRTSRTECPSPHSLSNKLARVWWATCWWTLFRVSPRILFRWRVLLLRCFGADVSWHSRVDPTARIWAPWNLSLADNASIGHHADIYNVARIRVAAGATVSQYSFLCSASHDITDPAMRLTAKPITVGPSAWVCARAFVGPGVTVGEGAVVAACGVAVRDAPPWTVVGGNPAREIGKREIKE